MLLAIEKVDPKKTVEIGGYHLDSSLRGNKKTVQLSKSETFLTDLMEKICEYFIQRSNFRFHCITIFAFLLEQVINWMIMPKPDSKPTIP